MAKKKAKMIVEGASVTGPQWKELVRQVVDGELTGEQVQAILGRRNPFIQNTKKLSPPDIILRLRDRWAEFWQVVGGRTLTDADLVLPALRSGLEASTLEAFTLPVVTPRDLKAEQLYQLTVDTNFFPCWKNWDNLDVLEVKESYLQVVDQAPVILVKPVVEASADLCLSYNQAIADKKIFISIRHRITMEPFGFWLNKDHPREAKQFGIPQHFDPKGWTRTASLAPVGRVANGSWHEAHGKFRVNWSAHGNADPHGGLRQAVC
ncbi:MAG: hypothetical protein AAB455_00030 [Patescibacteria group bacterium]